MSSEREEILVQRCVDNECTSAERRELIERLDSSADGWKKLACTYMEEQLFAAGCNAPANTVVQPLPVEEKRRSNEHWFNHPAVSMVLSACVVFLLGVIGAGEYQRRNNDHTAGLVKNDSQAPGTPDANLAAVDGAVSGTRDAVSGPQRAWLEADGMAPREFPVYQKVSEYLPSLAEFRQQGDQWSRDLGPRGSKSRISYQLVRTNDGLLVVPVEEFLIDQQVQ